MLWFRICLKYVGGKGGHEWVSWMERGKSSVAMRFRCHLSPFVSLEVAESLLVGGKEGSQGRTRRAVLW